MAPARQNKAKPPSPAKAPAVELPVLAFANPQDWDNWLAEQHASSPGIWLRFFKKASGQATVVYAEALDVALCYGWIDSQVKKYDAESYLQKFTRRRPRSLWSQVNREKVARLIAAGKMQPAGFKEIEAAQADGRWEAAYASFSNATVPEDLQALLDAHPEAQGYFDSLNKTQRYSFITRIAMAKKPETRQRRLQATLEKLLKQETW